MEDGKKQFSEEEVKKITARNKAILAHENLSPSAEAEALSIKVLKGDLTGDEAIKVLEEARKRSLK